MCLYSIANNVVLVIKKSMYVRLSIPCPFVYTISICLYHLRDITFWSCYFDMAWYSRIWKFIVRDQMMCRFYKLRSYFQSHGQSAQNGGLCIYCTILDFLQHWFTILSSAIINYPKTCDLEWTKSGPSVEVRTSPAMKPLPPFTSECNVWWMICTKLDGLKPYFSSEPFYKTGYWLGVCHGWFHLQGLTWPVQKANRELQNEKFMPTVWFEPGTIRLRSEHAISVHLLELINIDHLKVTAFYLRFLWKLPVPHIHLVLPVLFLETLSCIFLILYFFCIVLLYDFTRLLTVKSY